MKKIVLTLASMSIVFSAYSAEQNPKFTMKDNAVHAWAQTKGNPYDKATITKASVEWKKLGSQIPSAFSEYEEIMRDLNEGDAQQLDAAQVRRGIEEWILGQSGALTPATASEKSPFEKVMNMTKEQFVAEAASKRLTPAEYADQYFEQVKADLLLHKLRPILMHVRTKLDTFAQ